MYIETISNLGRLAPLYAKHGLKVPYLADYYIGYYDSDQLIGAGAIKDGTIQGIVVEQEHRSGGVSASIISELLSWAVSESLRNVLVFTTISNIRLFESLGFRLVVRSSPHSALLEWGTIGIDNFVSDLRLASGDGIASACLVMNCNPFTRGHLGLVERASRENERVYLIVVETDLSEFPFAVRFDLITRGVAHLHNVRLINGGRYVVSAATFPSYFTKDEDLARAHASLDVDLFIQHIAPNLNVVKRYVGTEPFSPVTNAYNEVMQEKLAKAGIELVLQDRYQVGDIPVSASFVRRLAVEGRFKDLEPLVPKTTFDFLTGPCSAPIIENMRREANKEKM